MSTWPDMFHVCLADEVPDRSVILPCNDVDNAVIGGRQGNRCARCEFGANRLLLRITAVHTVADGCAVQQSQLSRATIPHTNATHAIVEQAHQDELATGRILINEIV
jgi:hypothetical protein